MFVMPVNHRIDGDAIVADDLVKEYRGRGRRPVRAPGRPELHRSGRTRLRTARPERRRQVHHHQILTTLSRATAGAPAWPGMM
jgi:ABC-2 type transport system ATP-binding protein